MKKQEISKGPPLLKVLRPVVDICEDEEGFLLRADLPGVSQESLDLQVKRGLLRLSGQRLYHEGLLEYRRSFQVPREIDSEKISATLERGVLELRLPLDESYKPHRIPVQIRT